MHRKIHNLIHLLRSPGFAKQLQFLKSNCIQAMIKETSDKGNSEYIYIYIYLLTINRINETDTAASQDSQSGEYIHTKILTSQLFSKYMLSQFGNLVVISTLLRLPRCYRHSNLLKNKMFRTLNCPFVKVLSGYLLNQSS